MVTCLANEMLLCVTEKCHGGSDRVPAVPAAFLCFQGLGWAVAVCRTVTEWWLRGPRSRCESLFCGCRQATTVMGAMTGKKETGQ